MTTTYEYDSENIMSHLSILELRLSNERMRLAAATCPKEIALRSVWVKQCENEIAGEHAFLAKTGSPEVNTRSPEDEAAIDQFIAELNELEAN